MISGMIAALGDHAICLDLLVGVAEFEPAASSSRTERAGEQTRCSMTLLHVSAIEMATITTADRV
jgi:hypothetical protein